MTDVEKGIAIGMAQTGASKRSIAKHLNRDKATIIRLLRRYEATGDVSRRPGSGPPRKTSRRQDREIIRTARKRRDITSKELKVECSIAAVSSRTIRRRLNEAGLDSYWALRKPYISKVNQRKRVAWAKEHLHWTLEDWKQVLWSDESPFVLRYAGRKRVWRLHNERYRIQCLQGSVKHDKKINVWGCFSFAGVGKFIRIKGILVKERYKSILIHHMKPSARRLFGGYDFKFQQDNDPKHTAKIVQAYLRKQPFETLEWPSQSPDLNPIENLWSQLDRQVKNRKPQNEEELFDILQSAWNDLPPNYLQSLVQSMHRRCRAVIDSKGLPTKY